jgi:hypothetical protein
MAESTQYPIVDDRSRLGNGMNGFATLMDSDNDLIQAGHRPTGLHYFASTVLASWLAIILVLGERGTFVVPARTPPYLIVIGITAPILVFLAVTGVHQLITEQTLSSV